MSISASINHRIRRGATRLALLMLFASPAFAQPTVGLDVIVVAPGTVATTLVTGKLSLLANDSNSTGGRLVAKFGSSPLRGTLDYLNPDGTFSYSHGGGAFADSFKYKSCDQNNVCSTGSVAITTVAQDFAPNVGDDAAQVLQGGTVSVLDSGHASVLANDSEPNGETMTLQMIVPPSHGTADLAADGKFSYTHDGSQYFDSLQYRACDPQNQCATGTVLFHTTSNHAPAVQADAIVVAPSATSSTLASGASSLLANDSDSEGEAMVAAILHGGGPLHGSAIVNSDGTFTYTRGANSSDDSFQYVVCDIHDTCTLGKVFISTSGVPAVLSRPTISKSFGTSSVAFGGATTLTLHLSNPNAQPIVAVSVVDNYPAGLKNAAVGALVSNTCGGSAAAADAGASAALKGGVIAAGMSCDLVVKVVGAAAGTIVNQTGSVTSSNATSANGASASLTVAPPPPSDLSISKSLAGNLSRGQTGAPFVLTVSNVGGVASSGQVSVVDTLPAGLTAYAIKGSGWICTMPPTYGCTRSDALAAGASYPPIYVLSSAAADAAPSVTNKATVSNAGDANNSNNVASLSVTVSGNPVPVASNDAIRVLPGGTATKLVGGATSVLSNDSDPSGGALTALPIGSNPMVGIAGNLLLNPDGTFSYTNTDVSPQQTTDFFHYQACDAKGACSTALVTVIISNDPIPQLLPAAVGDAIQVGSGGTATALLGGATSVLTNDKATLAYGDVLWALPLGAGPKHGTLTLAGPSSGYNGTFKYVHDGSSSTTDSFKYQACSVLYAVCTSATVTITIGNGPLDQLPVAVNDAIGILPGGTSTKLIGGATSVLTNDSDPDGDTLIALPIGPNPMIGIAGQMLLNPDGTFTYTNTDVSPLQTTDIFHYQACDSHGACSTAAVAVVISNDPIPQLLPAAVGDAIQVGTGGTATALLGGATSVLANDQTTLAYGDALWAFPLGSGPKHGTLTLAGPSSGYNGTFKYVHDGSASTSDSFQYQACSILYTVCTAATVTITIGNGPLDQLPVAVNDAIGILPGGTSTKLIGGATSVLTNDSDPDGDTLIALPIGPNPMIGIAGQMLLNPDGTFTYTNTDVSPLQTTDFFHYQACDSHGACSVAAVTVIISDPAPPQTLPSAVGDAIQVPLGGTASTLIGGATSVLANDVAALSSGDALWALPLGSGPQHGSLVFNTPNGGYDGKFKYVHDGSATTSDSFQYQACSVLYAVCTAATVTITIGAGPADQLPVAVDDAVSVLPGGNATILVGGATSVLANDSDPDGGTLIASPIGPNPMLGTAGELLLNPDGSFSYSNTVVSPLHLADVFHYQACDSFGACDVATISVAIGVPLLTQTIDFTSMPPSTASVGGSYAVVAAASSGLPVSLTIDAASIGVCTIAGSAVAFTGAGSCTIVANQGGDATFAAAPSVTQIVTVAAAPGTIAQTIAFDSLAPSPAIVGDTYAVLATATSGLPVALNLDAASVGVCTIAGSTVTFIGTGACVITANQAGDVNFAAAPQVTQVVLVGAAQGTSSQTITINSLAPAPAIAGGTYEPSASASSGLPVSLTIDSSSAGICTIIGSTITFIGAGSCTILANQGGDATFAAAPQVTQVVLVEAAQGTTAQTITIDSTAPNPAIVGGTYHVLATASSGLPVSLTIDAASTGVCTITGSTVTFIGAGSCVIAANQGGDGTFAAAPQITQVVLVAAAPGTTAQTITIASAAPSPAVVGGTYGVLATASSGLPVSLTIDAASTSVCTITGSSVTFIGTGGCVIVANQGGNATFAAAPQVTQVVLVEVAQGTTSQTITIGSIAPNPALIGGIYNVLATASSGLPVALTIDAASAGVCTIAGSSVAFIATGNCVIVVNQAGDAAFAAAPQVTQVVIVETAQGETVQAVTIHSNPPLPAVVGSTYGVLATASSGLPVALTIDAASSGACTIQGSLVTFIGTGTCTVHADQSGDATFSAAPQATQSFAITSPPTLAMPQASDDAFTVHRGGSFNTATGARFSDSYTSVLGNDRGTSLTAVLVTPPAHAASITLDADGTLTYLNNGNAAATDSFTYNACDAQNECSLAVVFVTIVDNGTTLPPANDEPPLAADDAFDIAAAGTLDTTAAGVLRNGYSSVLANDRGQGLKAVLLAPPAHATAGFALNPNGTFSYSHNGDNAVNDRFVYEACEANGACSVAAVLISILPEGTELPPVDDDAPLAVDDALQLAPGSLADTSLAGGATLIGGARSVLSNDIGQGLKTAIVLTEPAHASLFQLRADGTVVYRHANDGSTSDSFSYQACNAHASCSPAIVRIVIEPGTNDDRAPVAADDFIVVAAGGSANTLTDGATSVLANDTDADGDVLHAIVLSQPQHGSVSFGPDGGFHYIHAGDGAAADSFAYEACDPDGACSSATVWVDATGVQGETAQSISFGSTAPDPALIGSTYEAIATATSALPVALTIDAASSAVCTIVGTTVAFIGAGDCVIVANQGGNATFAAAPPVTQSIAVAAASGTTAQTITITSTAPNPAVVGGTYNVAATASSGLPVALTIGAASSAVCKITGSTVTFIGAGSCAIFANQSGNAVFAAAPQVTQAFAILAAPLPVAQTITITSTAPNPAIVGGTYTVAATASSGLPVALTIAATSSSVCTIAGATVTFIGAGNCTVVANQAGNAAFLAAPQATQVVLVDAAQGTAGQTITIDSTPPAPAIAGGTYAVSATATSGLPVTLAIDAASSAVCAISGSTVTFLAAGNCMIVASQGGSANFAAALPVTQTVDIQPAGNAIFRDGFED